MGRSNPFAKPGPEEERPPSVRRQFSGFKQQLQILQQEGKLQPAAPWRLLWRGGLEVGRDRYRLDGIAFCARMSIGIPGPPSGTGTGAGGGGTKELAMHVQGSYFPVPAPELAPENTSTVGTPPRSTTARRSTFQPGHTSPAAAFATPDTDLCLSLESMKGRKTLRVRGVERFEEDGDDNDVIGEGEDGVHVYLHAPHSLLAQYIFDTLCRSSLTVGGRTRKALVVTLGDDVIDAPASATFLIYGRLKRQHETTPHDDDDDAGARGKPKLELLATSRRRRPQSKERVQPDRVSANRASLRPGEPLPRDTLYTDDQGFKVPTIMLSSRNNGLLRRTGSVAAQAAAARMSRVRSQSTIYMPPQPPSSTSYRGHPTTTMSLSSSSTGTITAMTTADKTPTTTTTMGKKLTPGRRGEKRKRPTEQQVAQDDERRRRAGKITAAAEPQYRHHSPGNRDSLAVSDVDQQPQDRLQSTAVVVAVAADDDDIGVLDNVEGIFSHRGRIDESSGNVDLHNTSTQRAPSSSSRSGMPSTDEWQAKNKASIKKRLLASLEVRRCGRDHPEFKEVFSVANKGACFALRNTIAAEPLDRDLIDKIVQAHLDLYLPVQDVISPIDERPPMRSAALPLVDTTLPSPGTDPSTDVVTIDILNDPDTTII